jgi:uncharacterized protein (DUF1800 family)
MTMDRKNPLAIRVARAGIRAGDEDLARLEKEGWGGWLSDQLKRPAEDEAHVSNILASTKLKIEYEAGDGYEALKEDRNLSSLFKPTHEMWHLLDWQTKMGWPERVRAGHELIIATHVRAVHSTAQLRESVVDFWRDHFTVNMDAVEDVAVALPTYDQDVLRRHAFGNFRDMLEAVTTSTAMLAYLNNASSKASPANENFARELLELHTLGAKVYYNTLYDQWKEVPGAVDGKAQGFIDQDVYEAARAFTGWTYEGGRWISEGVEQPMTGAFAYTEQWHDPYQKRILGVEFPSHAAPMMDGRKVLDLVAFHPATARHVCGRLCQRYVADQPSPELVEAAARIFEENAHAPDQLARVVEFVFSSNDFADAAPHLQRPLFLFASLQRSSGLALAPTMDHNWLLTNMGQKLYTWHTPAGHPLHSAYWQSPGFLLRRWRAMNDIWTKTQEQHSGKSWASIEGFADEWSKTLGLDAVHAQRSARVLKQQFGAEERQVSFNSDDKWVVMQGLGAMTASPNYQAV